MRPHSGIGINKQEGSFPRAFMKLSFGVFSRYLPNSTPMKVLLKKARIIAPTSPFHGRQKDISIRDGNIDGIGDDLLQLDQQLVEIPNLHVSSGWVDVFADFGEPGNEQHESIETGIHAAMAGGFTDVFLIPDNKPATSTRSQVDYIRRRAGNSAVTLHPIASITKGLQGAALAEMYDMAEAGAVAFSDGLNPVQNSGLMLKALQYVLPIQANIIQVPIDTHLSKHGLLNEGIMSTRLGMPGKPGLAEELALHRDLKLLEYTGSRLHVTGISTAQSLSQVMNAKQAGLRITCSVTPYHCSLDDDILEKYDTRYKVDPPIRSATNRDAIKQAVKNGMIDCFASHHLPRNWDEKTCEFEYASYGMEGLETAFGVYNNLGASLDTVITMLTSNPRFIFNLPNSQIEVGEKACLTLFDPQKTWIADEKHIRSASKNNGFLGIEMKGKVLGTINNSKFVQQEI